MKTAVRFTLYLSLALLLACLATGPGLAQQTALPDQPAAGPKPAKIPNSPASYSQALIQWRGVEEINRWIGANFSYDPQRALQLSETQRKKGMRLAIHPPQRLYENPRGVCVDLARFGVETARRISPPSKAAYLMIEFEPVSIKGQILRRHWLAVYQKDAAFYSFADSKRPGYLDGPYINLAALVASYEAFRKRKVISYRLLDDYRKKKKRLMKKRKKTRLQP